MFYRNKKSCRIKGIIDYAGILEVFADKPDFPDYSLLGVILIIDGYRKCIVVIYSFGFYGSVAVIVIFLLIAI